MFSGQYPTGVIDWGTNSWYLAEPWGQFSTKSISFNGASMTNALFTFLNPKKLVKIDAFNGGTVTSTVTLSCTGNPNRVVSVSVDTILTIDTGWMTACDQVTISSTNGWGTNFDNLVIE